MKYRTDIIETFSMEEFSINLNNWREKVIEKTVGKLINKMRKKEK
jgi:hypothetical protein